ncbi:helix-turn-helix domain-containing protein [Colwellia sp. 20A7]|jgi:transcriptional regulator with XRE-family HTH domain|uniref:helix-turn-helix domain-containing protein n=1 Tax=Colwellia sp. 20A7 TaxID=2689569 RepID=UPI00135AA1AB|nr:helix-turn-helix domain-containing protein [Colwellia sp. 20A7]
MSIQIKKIEQLGLLSKLVRKSQNIRQDDLGMMTDNSHVFIGQFENGKDTVEIGRVLKIMEELGIRLYADLPPELNENELKEKIALLLSTSKDK